LCTSLVQQRSQTPAGRDERGSRGTINQKRVSVASPCPSFSPRLRVLRCDVPFSSSPTRSALAVLRALGTPLLSLGDPSAATSISKEQPLGRSEMIFLFLGSCYDQSHVQLIVPLTRSDTHCRNRKKQVFPPALAYRSNSIRFFHQKKSNARSFDNRF
jgi:hypothetical protein